MNLLSGTTWKGAKLRIGEAKPDFRERYDTSYFLRALSIDRFVPTLRIKRENEVTPDDRPAKRRRLARAIQGVHAPNMSLVTPENVSSRPGWRVTPMGRIVRPIRMRPGKPLPPTSTLTSSTLGKKNEKQKRKREKAKLVRARRKTIDPTKWDSQHLKGAFLDSIVVADDGDNLPLSKPATAANQEVADLSSDSDDSREGEGGGEFGSSEPEHAVEGSPITQKVTSRPPQDTIDTDHDFNQEKFRALSLLDSMFGGLEGDQEWGGKEVLDSDVDMPEISPTQSSPSPQPTPSKAGVKESDLKSAVQEARKDAESEISSTDAFTPAPERAPTTQNANTTKAKLKDLFAPQEEQGASSLADYLWQI